MKKYYVTYRKGTLQGKKFVEEKETQEKYIEVFRRLTGKEPVL